MDRPPADDRSAISLAWAWATRIIVISAEMVLPALAGYWIDQRLGTKALFMLLGFALGITLAVLQLVRIAKESQQQQRRPPKNPRL
jgi:F0F1-type ATP synthase assembly protein I